MKKLLLEDDNRCFACGMDNLDGLRVQWVVDGLTMTGRFVPEKKFQGWQGIVHGGILATLLDEAMTRLAGILSGGAVTAEMTVRYSAPAHIGHLLLVKGELIKDSRKLMELKATIHKEDGTLIASATGKAIKI
ncbi:MAG: PaaI family thioesterase [Parachlamydiales bacterium]|nr:PaaI family thioesterase [Parachlamydiales bacterium]